MSDKHIDPDFISVTIHVDPDELRQAGDENCLEYTFEGKYCDALYAAYMAILPVFSGQTEPYELVLGDKVKYSQAFGVHAIVLALADHKGYVGLQGLDGTNLSPIRIDSLCLVSDPDRILVGQSYWMQNLAPLKQQDR